MKPLTQDSVKCCLQTLFNNYLTTAHCISSADDFRDYVIEEFSTVLPYEENPANLMCFNEGLWLFLEGTSAFSVDEKIILFIDLTDWAVQNIK